MAVRGEDGSVMMMVMMRRMEKTGEGDGDD